MKHCPYCGEEIQDSAQKCRFCGEWLKKEIEENKTSEIPAAPQVEDTPSPNNTEELKKGQTSSKKKNKITVPVFWPSIPSWLCHVLFLLVGGLLVVFEMLPEYDFPFSALSGIISLAIYVIAYIQFEKHKCSTPLFSVAIQLMIAVFLIISIIELSNGAPIDELLEEEPIFSLISFIGIIGCILLLVSWLRGYSGRIRAAVWILLIPIIPMMILGVVSDLMDVELPLVITSSFGDLIELYVFFGIFFGEKMGSLWKETK